MGFVFLSCLFATLRGHGLNKVLSLMAVSFLAIFCLIDVLLFGDFLFD